MKRGELWQSDFALLGMRRQGGQEQMWAVGTLILGALSTAVLFVLAMPLGERGYLAWFALAPLIAATRGRGFLVGFLSAMVSMGIGIGLSLSGILYAHPHLEGASLYILTCYAQFCFTFAVLFGLNGEPATSRLPAWWFASVSVLLNAVQLLVLPADFSLTQYRNHGMLMLASLGGIWLVGFLLVWVNFLVSRLPLGRAIGLSVLAAVLSVGLTYVSWPIGGGSHRYAVVQYTEDDDEHALELHQKASQSKPTFVVWREFGGIAFVHQGDVRELAEITENSSPLVTSFPDTYSPMPHNVCAAYEAGSEHGRYEKRKLFGGEKQMHTPGNRPGFARLSTGNVGLNICFDTCYPSIIRDTVAQAGVDVVAVPTHDPVTPHNFLAAMHAAFTPFRAAETGAVIVRGDSDAHSMIVDGRGVITREVGAGEEVMVGEARHRSSRPPAFYLGEWILVLFGWLGGLPVGKLLVERWRRRKSLY